MMRIIDEYHTEHPTSGVVHMRDMLRLRGYSVNEKRVRRLMRKMRMLHEKPAQIISYIIDYYYLYCVIKGRI